MKLAISQIAWNIESELTVLQRLKELNISAIEVVPARLKTAKHWVQHELKPVAMQSLLYGQPEWNLFSESRFDLLLFLQDLLRSAAQHKVKNLVFGSPKNRWIPAEITADVAHKLAKHFFTQLAGMAAEHDLCICIEPNPTAYHCNFLTTAIETVNFLEELNKPHLKLNLDLGALQLNHENPTEVIFRAKNLIQHVHVSEPHLKPVTTLTDFHTTVFGALKEIDYQNFYSIEMKQASEDTDTNLQIITDAVNVVAKALRD